MAMPIGSMIAKFRGEFEQHIEQARMRNNLTLPPVPPDEQALLAHGAP
jgi:NADH-quinone oxidoreductase subunit F